MSYSEYLGKILKKLDEIVEKIKLKKWKKIKKKIKI